MEEETNSSRNRDKRLLKLSPNNPANYVFDIGADVCVIILSQLRRSHKGKEEEDEEEAIGYHWAKGLWKMGSSLHLE